MSTMLTVGGFRWWSVGERSSATVSSAGGLASTIFPSFSSFACSLTGGVKTPLAPVCGLVFLDPLCGIVACWLEFASDATDICFR
ncbi:hypothetical protein SETIT_9G104800v2 [Setaria italica]|uniref:Uncharacterized protein n=1 Tax=Setaria italica TaxID=4555 RepID=A0A368SFB0_SETIT|nr:hypothetical protein SETIT_9G104800v2 [Setaria italica]